MEINVNSGDMLALTMVNMEAVILVGVIQIIPVRVLEVWKMQRNGLMEQSPF